MNKRIRELAEKQGLTGPNYLISSQELEKFAELIVQESIQTLIDNTPERYTNEAAEEDWDKGYENERK